MENKIKILIVTSLVIAAFFIPSIESIGQENEHKEIGIISEMSKDGTVIQVGSRYYSVTEVYIIDGTTEEPIPSSSWLLEPGKVVIVYYSPKYKYGNNSYKADKVIMITGKDTKEIIKELEAAGLYFR